MRRAKQKTQRPLRGTRCIWLHDPQTLSDRRRATLGGLPTRHLKTASAYQIRLAFQELSDQPSVQAGSRARAHDTLNSNWAAFGSGTSTMSTMFCTNPSAEFSVSNEIPVVTGCPCP